MPAIFYFNISEDMRTFIYTDAGTTPACNPLCSMRPGRINICLDKNISISVNNFSLQFGWTRTLAFRPTIGLGSDVFKLILVSTSRTGIGTFSRIARFPSVYFLASFAQTRSNVRRAVNIRASAYCQVLI